MNTWIKILGGFGVAVAAVLLVPRLLEAGSSGPPPTTLLLTGVIVGLATTSLLYLIVTRDLGLGRTVATFAAGYNLLLVLVKFVLAPYGLYEVNQTSDLTFELGSGFGTAMTAGGVFAIYVTVYGLLYFVFRRRITARVSRLPTGTRVAIALTALVGVILLVVGAFYILALWALLGAAEYLIFVFSSVVSVAMALALVAAITVAGLAFKEARDRAMAVGNAAMLTNFFWVGLAFIAMYHALWVIFIVTLAAIWPLKVVTPK